MSINPRTKTIQLIYDASSALLNGNVLNFQLPVQGYYDVFVKQAEVVFGGATELILSVKSPQLRLSYSCSNTTNTNGSQTNSLGLQPLSSNFLLNHRNGANTITSKVLFPRVLLQNTIQMSIDNIITRLPIDAPIVIIFTLELHSCDDVLDTTQGMLPYV
jgi:hypothetical protein